MKCQKNCCIFNNSYITQMLSSQPFHAAVPASVVPALATPELALILVSTRFYLKTATADEVISLLDSDINWDTFLQTAIDHRIVPLVYQALKTAVSDRIPDQVMAQLRSHCYAISLRNLIQTQKLLRLLDELEANNIPAVPFKGPALAMLAYGSISFRQFADLDILVQPQDFRKAKAVLNAQGYHSFMSKALERYSAKRDLQLCLKQSEQMNGYQESSIDLHWGIPPRRVFKLDLLWKELGEVNLLEKRKKSFSIEATLVVQCINVVKNLRDISFNQLCDVAQIVCAHPDLDWERCLEISAGLGTQRLFLLGLSYAYELLQLPLPQCILDKSTRLAIHPPSIEEVYRQIFLGQHKSDDTLQIYWFFYTERVNQLDHYWDAVFVTLQFCYILLDIILLPNDKDFKAISLPNWLSFLYYPFHLLRQLSKLVFLPLELLFRRNLLRKIPVSSQERQSIN